MKTFQVITNSSCNLRCTYCYEYLDSKQNKVEDVIEYLESIVKPNKDRDTECIIDFIGGEPFFCSRPIGRSDGILYEEFTKLGL